MVFSRFRRCTYFGFHFLLDYKHGGFRILCNRFDLGKLTTRSECWEETKGEFEKARSVRESG
jgi:hypothetical protein